MFVRVQRRFGDPNSGSMWGFVTSSSPASLVRSMFTGDIDDAQRQKIAADCAGTRQRASGGRLTYEQALQQCRADVDQAVPKSCNFMPYVLAASGTGLLLGVLLGRKL